MDRAVLWCIYYGDGSTYSSEDGSPFDAPPINVQMISQRHGERRELLHGRDFYWWKDGEWYMGDERGWYQHLFGDRGPKALLFGTTIGNEAFAAILKRAIGE